MKWSVNIYNLADQLIPYWLKRAGTNLLWETADGLLWITSSFQAWGTAGSGKHSEWVKTLVSPISFLNGIFVEYATEVYYRLSITGQVVYLEHYLNDLFDSDNRGIYITDDNLIFPPFLFRTGDDIPVGEELILYPDSDPITLYNQDDFFTQGSFIVNVPSSLPLNTEFENRIRRAVNQYKQAGVQYTIVNY